MESRWSDAEAKAFLDRYGEGFGEDLALRTYTARLLGMEKSLVLHGGGNTSVKAAYRDVLDRAVPAVFVKASGRDLAVIEPEGHPGLDLDYLKRLRSLSELPDPEMVNQLRTHLFDHQSLTPSIETLVHAFLDRKFIDHTHADAVLALTNQPDGERIVGEVMGDAVIVMDYVTPGFKLAKAAADAVDKDPGKRGLVWMRHGLVTWGDTAKESYEATIELVSKAEAYLAKHAGGAFSTQGTTTVETAEQRWLAVAPVLRGLLAARTDNMDRPFQRVVLSPLINDRTLAFVDGSQGKKLALAPPLTSDHLIRTKACPLWIDAPDFGDPEKLREQAAAGVDAYRTEYDAYLKRHAGRMEEGVAPFAPSPRVVLVPGLGAVCAGEDVKEAAITRDITEQTLAVKALIGAMGTYQGLPEEELFAMEYRGLQHAKLDCGEPPLRRHTALITGAAGAIGSGICRGLLDQGCHVAVTDLAGEHLDGLTRELQESHGGRVIGVPMDVTDPGSVAGGFDAVIRAWGGVDLVVVNAGIALVSSLETMDLEAFRRLEKVNVEGTLLLLRQAARHFKVQGTGGDVVLVSTKNVFAPGATFGAYSATKAASHQLARIASLEMAGLGVRVNMVSPDAVFSDGARRSGLWAEVGPDRMKARGLDEKGLEEYYRKRNLLQTQVTADHVANAVLFFATRQTPTTGATIPVDGGLPDSTPR